MSVTRRALQPELMKRLCIADGFSLGQPDIRLRLGDSAGGNKGCAIRKEPRKPECQQKDKADDFNAAHAGRIGEFRENSTTHKNKEKGGR